MFLEGAYPYTEINSEEIKGFKGQCIGTMNARRSWIDWWKKSTHQNCKKALDSRPSYLNAPQQITMWSNDHSAKDSESSVIGKEKTAVKLNHCLVPDQPSPSDATWRKMLHIKLLCMKPKHDFHTFINLEEWPDKSTQKKKKLLHDQVIKIMAYIQLLQKIGTIILTFCLNSLSRRSSWWQETNGVFCQILENKDTTNSMVCLSRPTILP